MTKREIRRIGVDFIVSMEDMIYEMMHKHTIDDIGTQSEKGYEGENYDKIEKDILFY